MKIVCDDKIPFLRGVLEPYAEVVYMPGKAMDLENVKDADALIIRTRTHCNKDLLEGSSVKVIATATIGYDHIDTAWCESSGIIWSNAPGCNSGSVDQYIASALCTLALKKNFHLEGKTLGVVGVGNVGSKVVRTARSLGMNVLQNDPPRALKEGPAEFVDLETIVQKSDIITLHVPLAEDTIHLFDEKRIAQLRPSQILINASRGPVVDNKALKIALKNNALLGAVMDTWEGEPDIDLELLQLLDIATPHIAGYSADGKANGTSASVQLVSRVLGLPLTDWKVTEIPAPPQSLHHHIDEAGKTLTEILQQKILYTYDIEKDSRALKADPALFEKLRGDYPVRREMGAFKFD